MSVQQWQITLCTLFQLHCSYTIVVTAPLLIFRYRKNSLWSDSLDLRVQAVSAVFFILHRRVARHATNRLLCSWHLCDGEGCCTHSQSCQHPDLGETSVSGLGSDAPCLSSQFPVARIAHLSELCTVSQQNRVSQIATDTKHVAMLAVVG